MKVNFHIRGPHGAGVVYTEMFKDNADKKWKFTYLIVEIKSPTKAQLMLESYVPAWDTIITGRPSACSFLVCLETVKFSYHYPKE